MTSGRFWCWHKWKPHYRWLPERTGVVWPGIAGTFPAGKVRIGSRCAKCGKETTKDWLDRVLSAIGWMLCGFLVLSLATLVVLLAREIGPEVMRGFMYAWTGRRT